MTYNKNEIIIRFTDVAEQPSVKEADASYDTPIKRLVGFVAAKNLFPLFENAGLAANPRSSRKNAVVEDILTTLTRTPALFRFKSKGVLVGTGTLAQLLLLIMSRKRARTGYIG